MTDTPRFDVTRIAATIGLIFILVLPCLIGSVSSAVVLVMALAMLPVLRRPGAFAQVRADPTLIIMFVAFVVLSLIFAITAQRPYDLLYFTNFLSFALAPVVAVVAIRESGPRTAVLICALCLAGAFVGVAIGVFDLTVRHLDRAEGFFGNANVLARAAAVLGFVAMGGLFVTSSPRRVIFYLGPVLAIAAIYLSASRGAALALPGLLIVAFVAVVWNPATRRHLPILLGLLAAGFAGLVIFSGDLTGGRLATTVTVIIDALQTGGTEDHSSEIRLHMYRAGLEAFQYSPWIGQGWGNLGPAAAAVDPVHFAKAETEYFMFHNDLVNFAVAAGVVGIATWIMLLLAPLIGAFWGPRDTMFGARLYCCVQISVGYALLGLTDMSLGYDLLTTLYAFLTVAILATFRAPVANSMPATANSSA